MPPPRQRPLGRASSSSDSVGDDAELDDDELLQLSSSDSSAGPSPTIPKIMLGPNGDVVDEISKDLAELEQLRKSVQTNLRLRPIRSKGKLPKLDVGELGMKMPGAFPMSARLKDALDAESPAASNPSTSGLEPAFATNLVPVQPAMLTHADTVHATASTDGIAQDRRAVSGMSPHMQNISSLHRHPTASSSSNTIPTGSKPKLKHKTKGPPPALVLSHSRTSTPQSGSPRNLHNSTSEGELILPDLHLPVRATTDPRPPPLTVTTDPPLSATSPTSSILSSYFTPAGDTPITSRFIGAYYSSPVSAVGPNAELNKEDSSSANATVTPSPVAEPLNTTSSNFTTSPNTAPKPTNHQPQPILAADLYARLTRGVVGQPQPLVIDTRAPAAHVANRIRGSVNIAIPSLILKRCKKLTAAGGNSDFNPSPNVGSSAPQTGGGKGGFQSLESLRQFVVGEKAKSEWSKMVCSLHRTDDGKEVDALAWDGDIIVYDEEMEQDTGSTAWILMDVLMALTRRHGGRVDYLEGGIMKGVKDTKLEKLIDLGPMGCTVEEESSVAIGGRKFSAGGLFQLDTKKKPSDIEISSTLSSASTSLSSNPTSPAPFLMPRSPINTMPPPLNSSLIPSGTNDTLPKPLTSIPVHVIHEVNNELDPAPSPPPSSLIFRPYNPLQVGPPTGCFTGKGAGLPNLRAIDTSSAEKSNSNPPKLSVRTKPMRSATLTVPPRLTLPGLRAPASPSHLNLAYSSHSPPASARYTGAFGIGDGGNSGMTPYYTPPHTPKAISSFYGGSVSAHPSLHGGHSSIFGYNSGADSTPSLIAGGPQRDKDYPPSPLTARPEPPSTESESMPTFTISTILPNFLFLGPELTEPSHVEQLKELGVKRILNIAMECNEDDFGLNLKERFKYVKIPMRDTVEEENVQKGVRQACEILDDARLHSAPTYVHCKAGKSRSVTAVMAYLIHANHWTLSRAYAFVLERRKGISPNIGFVSELMSFEERELGGKSIGVQSNSMGGENGEGSSGPGEDSSFGGMNLRRGGHVRESLPPLESFSSSAASNSGNAGPGGTNTTVGLGGPVSAGGIQLQRVLVGDHAQETEVKDASGRYRHARRAPVDENTLQPLRRVSKAGLESSAFEEVPRGERGRGGEREASYGA